MDPEKLLRPFRGLDAKLPVTLAAPSFVWPAGWADNAERLSGVFPFIQLLLHEPLHRSPLPTEELLRLKELAGRGVRYLIHMPVPGGLDDPGRDPVAEYLEIIKTTRPLKPEGYVIHLESSGRRFNGALAGERLEQVMEKSGMERELFLVENLDDRFHEHFRTVEQSGVAVCLDWGHILRDGGDPAEWAERYGSRIRAAHIHGVSGSGDHVPLSCLRMVEIEKMFNVLGGLDMPGPVVIENYRPEDMAASLKVLADIYGG